MQERRQKDDEGGMERNFYALGAADSLQSGARSAVLA